MPDELAGPAARARWLGDVDPRGAAAQHATLRDVFRAEMAAWPSDELYENLYWCAFLLYLVGDPADVPMMWQAKHIDFDSACGFDVQFMLGAGPQQTLDYLRAHGHDDIARELSAYPELADDLDEWEAFRRGYFYD